MIVFFDWERHAKFFSTDSPDPIRAGPRAGGSQECMRSVATLEAIRRPKEHKGWNLLRLF